MTNNGGSTRIEFSELKQGYARAAPTTFADGYADGEKAANTLSIKVVVLFPDLELSLHEPAHAGTLNGVPRLISFLLEHSHD